MSKRDLFVQKTTKFSHFFLIFDEIVSFIILIAIYIWIFTLRSYIRHFDILLTEAIHHSNYYYESCTREIKTVKIIIKAFSVDAYSETNPYMGFVTWIAVAFYFCNNILGSLNKYKKKQPSAIYTRIQRCLKLTEHCISVKSCWNNVNFLLNAIHDERTVFVLHCINDVNETHTLTHRWAYSNSQITNQTAAAHRYQWY